MDIKPLITAEQIGERLADMGRRISEDYAGKDVLLVGVLRGAFMVMADLARHITVPSSSTSWPFRHTGRRRRPRVW
jgi:hypoxanthine phosphoribosyltransferase